MSKKSEILRCAAIVCSHVAKDRKPILVADRETPEDPADSGWQFLCGAEFEEWNLAQVWSLGEVIDVEPTLEPFINMNAGSRLVRNSAQDEWMQLPGEVEKH
ncbi:DUF2185 domain-containing protein [Pelomonas sp. P7]|uniref:DUF2185 domain-containing protein n=1 Tax=Pelomonas caseinilytica TaxID=2906763 RepID=A0ABS8XIZ3_9BURK|nr:DUF2185 domain-containing protein [Pelomonas sp. P7]MCE4538543.1 DUF2185 domain-containing protein [Pelomonas sp. P7]